MDHPVDRALHLWSEPVPTGDAGVAAFRTVYADPLQVNGSETALRVLVDRARMLQSAFDGLRHTMLERFDLEGRSAFAFRLSGRHVGPLATPIGVVPATGRDLSVLAMDLFVIEQDRVREVWALADYLDLLVQAAAVEFSPQV